MKERVTFLSPNKKVTKEVGIREALIASQNAPSPKNPSREPESKTKPQDQGENVPIFALPSIFFCFLTECATGDSRVFGARERDIQRLLSRLLFVLFLPKQENDIILLNTNLSVHWVLYRINIFSTAVFPLPPG